MTERRTFTTAELAQWVYDHTTGLEVVPDDLPHSEWGAWFAAHPDASGTFPPYYAADYDETIASLCRELLEMRDLVKANAIVQGQMLAISQANDARDSAAESADLARRLLGGNRGDD
ncbi:hypothetical protein KDJ57_gp40 [Gordonia phage Catfish]|uniref:Uncharacterized protein n=1 Tax=Gordonia phage Catfish TaxID=2301538 RepID=A0A385D0Z7_9CAUD|nr:hypothetical protein KDJ57_gp40 [Gordonia phage Catfish]AXQ51905.1 hypothetical protein SEA_CATFISH_69 [Gordonia phage Catfish]